MPKLPRNVRKHGGRYQFRAVVRGESIQRDFGTDSVEMRRLVKLLRQELKAGPIRNEPRQTVAAFGDRWLSECIAQGRNQKGYELASQRLSDHVSPILGNIPLESVSSSNLRALRTYIEAKGLSIQSVRHIMGDARSLLRYAVDVDALPKSPWKPSLMPKLPEQVPRPLDDQQIESILAAAPARYQLAIRLSIMTGLRWSELHRLKWSDVKDLPSPHLVVEKTKSGKVRRIPLADESAGLLKKERSQSRSEFVNSWRSKFAGHAMTEIRRLSKVQFTWHQLRHTFACRWLDAGGSKESLQKILGHSTILQTERYGHMSDAAVFAEAMSLKVGQKVGQKGLPKEQTLP